MALKGLRDDPNIIVKEADKGGGVVLLNTKDYLSEVEWQLGDINYYVPLTRDSTDEIANIIKIVVQEALELDIIDIPTSQFLMKEYPCIPVFYVLPKVHKEGFPPPGRPIVSAMGYLMEPLSQYVDHHLKPFVGQIPTFIKDTGHFITMVEGLEIPESAV